ncbi:unnamed protein product [Vitrella brassicaformis CCMP3155]|uniref:folate gamma-glutamyl hydrolase n=1 Tax=Vitrella brassicaformis (strain CCMP3155) TaxID=1169540 RepID=A0A0G4EYA8_VITBC|nr:unnamed protein product [Vitrella brassicaformis CCMP3155]|mmetsp:Transcript_13986/g.33302  ORF Transcript_13986/g.33302 Transcript_13986/m.33302 type:complete len:446 (-) Transcript_13986:1580-2917(-)|eukprot:CEM04335.1 unnamed protein product [Vitrella brassicaformis CCMP3155]
MALPARCIYVKQPWWRLLLSSSILLLLSPLSRSDESSPALRHRSSNSSSSMNDDISPCPSPEANSVMDNRSGTGTGRPIIGIVTQPSNGLRDRLRRRGEDATVAGEDVSTIAASYVRFVESGGARVVPVRYDASEDEWEYLFNSINGILFPGGAMFLEGGSPYMRAHEFFVRRAMKAFDQGDYFPVWGTCLGFEAIVDVISGDYSLIRQSHFNDSNHPSNLSFDRTHKPIQCSRMFRPLMAHPHADCRHESGPVGAMNGRHDVSAPDPGLWSFLSPTILQVLENAKVVYYNHERGINLTTWESTPSLMEFFDVLSTSRDKNGVDFVSTIESRRYPIYGVQWHPEKNAFEWSPWLDIPHSSDAVRVTQYLALFLANEARKSSHTFPSRKAEFASLIYHFPSIMTADAEHKYTFEQLYLVRARNHTKGSSSTAEREGHLPNGDALIA